MARSSSYNFALQRDDIINAAFRLIGVLGEDQTASTTRLTQAGQALNMMIKLWQAEGMGLWLNKEVVLIPQADTVQYYLGPASDSTYGSYACLKADYQKTEISTAVAAAGTVVNVDTGGATNWSSGYYIGVETDNEDVHWTEIDSITADAVTVKTALDYAAAVDNHVYYATDWSTERPLEVIEAWVRDADELDVPIEVESLNRYRELSNKTSEGRPTMIAVDYQLDLAVVYVWPEPDNMKQRIHLIAKYPVQDFDTSSDNADFPVEWSEALVYNLAIRLAAEYGRTPSQLVTAMALQSLEMLKSFDREQVSVFFKPNPRSYRR